MYNILQLRVHEAIIGLKKKIDGEYKNKKEKYDIDLTYVTSRGKWYFTAWKGDLSKSGGVASNIGIHFFDMLIWIFGQVKCHEVHYSEPLKKMAGYVELERANVRWFLSVDNEDLPEEVKAKGIRTHRSITINGEELEFSEGFADLHTIVYKDILNGAGYGINDARPSINLVYDIKNACVTGLNEKTHHLAKEKLNGK